MITYKSKIITYLAWILIAYLILQKYTEYKNKPKYCTKFSDYVNLS